MRRSPSILCLCALAAGCGEQVRPADARDARAAERRDQELAALRAQVEAHEERVRELSARLALSQAEARDLRDALSRREPAERGATVRIGGDTAPAEPEEPWPEEHDEAPDDGPRPVLRLYGQPSRPGGEPPPPLVVPDPPPGVPDRLAVVPLPGEVDVPPPALDPSPATGAGLEAAARPDDGEQAYREALRLVTARRFEEAASAFDRFLERYDGHARVADALYWRGVSSYARRRYDRALADFRRIVERHRGSERAADAMLKMGMCHMRMGDDGRARAVFRRVRQEFPNSVAARMASREDAS